MTARLDVSGRRYGALEVLEPDGSGRWRVLCECGHTRTVRVKDLQSGNTTSCGCRINRPRVSHGELTDRQRVILGEAARRGGRVELRTLLDMLHIHQASVSRNCRRLVDRRFLRMGPAGRYRVLLLTPTGWAAVHQVPLPPEAMPAEPDPPVTPP